MCKWFWFLANVVSIFFSFGINERPITDFHFSLLAPISKQGSGTENDEWIVFKLYTDAKSKEVFFCRQA